MKKAIYPGSFDPVTNGHLDIIKRATQLFDQVIIAIVRNPDKKAFFSCEDRYKMLTKSLKGNKKIVVEDFDGLLVDYVKKKKANIIVRGLRAVSDFDYEFQMALTNRQMVSNIETLFFMTDYKYSYLSSSFVKQIARLGGDISEMVPKAVLEML